MMSESPSPMPEQVVTTHVVGIDIGMESCTMSCLTVDKRQVIKSTSFADTLAGFDWLFERLEGLGVARKQILVGLEATSRYGENLLPAVLKRGYQVCLLHPAQMHAFAQQRGLRAKTDQLDAVTIARALRSCEARFGYVPNEQVATYRELMRLQKQREPMTWCATKMRSTPCWSCFSQNSRRSLLIPHGPPLWRSSNAIQAHKPSRRPRWRPWANSCMNWRRAMTGGQLRKSWWGWPKCRSAVGWPSPLAHRACAFSAISCNIPRRIWSSCNRRSTSCWTRTPRPKACSACRNLDRQQWPCCGQNWGISLASRASTRWSPTLGSICRSNRAANGKGRPSSPSTAAAECAASCT